MTREELCLICGTDDNNLEEYLVRNTLIERSSEIICIINWPRLSTVPNLSEDFIIEFQDKLNWWRISYNQQLSEDFIREFQDKVDWEYISLRSKLSEDFIREFKDKVHWENIIEFQKVSKDFIEEFTKLGYIRND